MIQKNSEQRPLTVSELTQGIKRLLETQVGDVRIQGEIGNFTVSARGHAYFNLKDADAMISCVFFVSSRKRSKADLEEGACVIVRGRISVYEARGQYQLIVTAIEQTGLGDLYQRFLALKETLQKQGLFDEERKQTLPQFPQRIGIVTSPTGAALRDMIHVIRRRFPAVELILSPTLVQGDEAPQQIVRALDRLLEFQKRSDNNAVDVIIIGRGGGSIEDLWAFNDEQVARAISQCSIPVISAVGHETDFTIADFVADVRAATPSAAAEQVVCEMSVLKKTIQQHQKQLSRSLSATVQNGRLKLERLVASWGLRQPLDLVHQAMQKVDALAVRSRVAVQGQLRDSAHRFIELDARCNALDPSRVLKRGYSIVSLARNGRIVSRQSQARPDTHLRIQLSEGELSAMTLPAGDDFLDGMFADVDQSK